MKAISDIKERQEIALGVLLYFREFCEQHHIQFFLAYGTLLGAVRHKGFIPWDDDVDVMLTRPEYEKFVRVWSNDEHPYYKFMSMETDKEYFAPLAKMYDDRTLVLQEYGQIEKKKHGIYIDVYVIDKLPDDFSVAATYYRKCQKVRKQWGMAVRKFSVPYSSVLHFIGRVPYMIYCKSFGSKFYMRKYNFLAQKYKNENTNHSGIVIYGEGLKKEFFEDKMFATPSIVEFQGTKFDAPSDVDAYLKQMYGDYMELPPVGERKIHPSKTFWI